MRLFAIFIIPHHRCAILSIFILFKPARPWAYVASWKLLFNPILQCIQSARQPIPGEISNNEIESPFRSVRSCSCAEQSTVSTCRSLRFSPHSCTDVNLIRTVPVAFPRHFRSKKRNQLVAAYLACQSVARVGVFPLPTCVKSRSLPVNKARWRNHVTDL